MSKAELSVSTYISLLANSLTHFKLWYREVDLDNPVQRRAYQEDFGKVVDYQRKLTNLQSDLVSKLGFEYFEFISREVDNEIHNLLDRTVEVVEDVYDKLGISETIE